MVTIRHIILYCSCFISKANRVVWSSRGRQGGPTIGLHCPFACPGFEFHSSRHQSRQYSMNVIFTCLVKVSSLSFYFLVFCSLHRPSVSSKSANVLSTCPFHPVLGVVRWSVILTLTIIGTVQVTRPPSPQVTVKMSKTLGDR